MDWQYSGLIYQNPLATYSDIKDFRLEGNVLFTFPENRLRMENAIDPAEGQKSNFVLWCPLIFPDNIAIEWEFRPIKEPGLCMLFFAAGGKNGEDLFDAKLQKRTGEYNLYHHGDINAYHVSYFRRKYSSERAFHTCNLRKSYGFNLVCQGADPIPSVEDVISPYHLQLVKYGPKVWFNINGLNIFLWNDDGKEYGPVLREGKIGFRQMSPLIGEYSNLKIYSLK